MGSVAERAAGADAAAAPAPLPHAAIHLRSRSHWQAIDLGIALARRHFMPLLAAWCVVALPALLVAIVVAGPRPSLVLLLFWWLKPACERLPLLWLSRVLFAERPRLRVLLATEWRALTARLPRLLTWARLWPMRSFDAAVDVLERPAGRAPRRRRLALLRRDAGAAAWLTVVGAHVEAGIVVGAWLVAMLLTPRPPVVSVGFEPLAAWFTASGPTPAEILVGFAASALVAPFYVAAGFCVYLNRRCQLEAWDLQVGFARIAARLRAVAPAGLGAVAVVAVLATLPAAPAFAAGGDAFAPAAAGGDAAVPAGGAGGDDAAVLVARERARSLVADVLAGPDFHQRRPSWRLEWEDDADGETGRWLLDLLAAAARVMSEVVSWVLWLLVGTVAVVVAWHYRAWLQVALAAVPRRRPPLPPLPLRVAAAAGSAPPGADTAGAARALWRQGRHRPAVAALYRGALVLLAARHGVPLRAGDTEQACLHRVCAAGGAQAVSFAALVQAWQRVAYAHTVPDEAEFDALARWLEQASA